MADAVEYAIFAVAAIVFAIGYRRNNRNLMLAGAVLIVAGDFLKGFVAGSGAAVR